MYVKIMRLASSTLLIMSLLSSSSAAKDLDGPLIFPMTTWVENVKGGTSRDISVMFNARIRNRTERVLCVLNTYFPYILPQYLWIYNLTNVNGDRVHYKGIIGEEGFPQNPYRILPPGESMESVVDLGQLYSFSSGEYKMRFILFVPYCDAFRGGYFPIPSPQNIGWESGQIPPEAIPVRDKGVFFDSGTIEFGVK